MKILIADDSLIVRKSLKRLLISLNNPIEIYESINVKHTIDIFQELNPDLIILDIMMPDGNGMDALKVIKQRNRDQKVLIYTNFPNPLNRKKCMDLGADYFVDKTSEYGLILDIIKEIIENEENGLIHKDNSKPKEH